MMKRCLLPVLLFAVSIPTLSNGSTALQQTPIQQGATRGVDRTARLPPFVIDAVKSLGIPIVILDKVSLQGTIDAQKDVTLSKEDLLNTLTRFLRENGAWLVKSGMICQIVPLSQNLGDGWEPITNPTEIPSIQQGSMRKIMMAFAGARLSDFCANIAQMLNITPIAIDPAIQGSVTLHTATPVTREIAFATLMTVLKNNDAVIIHSVGKYQIVSKPKDLPPGWEVLTYLPLSPRP